MAAGATFVHPDRLHHEASSFSGLEDVRTQQMSAAIGSANLPRKRQHVYSSREQAQFDEENFAVEEACVVGSGDVSMAERASGRVAGSSYSLNQQSTVGPSATRQLGVAIQNSVLPVYKAAQQGQVVQFASAGESSDNAQQAALIRELPPGGPEVLFAKKLTNSDCCTRVCKAGRITLPRASVEGNLGTVSGKKHNPLECIDENGKRWIFVITWWPNGTENRRVFVLEKTAGYIAANKLGKDSFFAVYRRVDGKLGVESNTKRAKESALRPIYASEGSELGGQAGSMNANAAQCQRAAGCRKVSGHSGFCDGLKVRQRDDEARQQRMYNMQQGAEAPINIGMLDAFGTSRIEESMEGSDSQGLSTGDRKNIIVAKMLTSHDVNSLRVVLPREDIEKHVPEALEGSHFPVTLVDEKNVGWQAVIKTWANGPNKRMFVMEQIGPFLKHYKLQVGDCFGLTRKEGSRLGIVLGEEAQAAAKRSSSKAINPRISSREGVSPFANFPPLDTDSSEMGARTGNGGLAEAALATADSAPPLARLMRGGSGSQRGDDTDGTAGDDDGRRQSRRQRRYNSRSDVDFARLLGGGSGGPDGTRYLEGSDDDEFGEGAGRNRRRRGNHRDVLSEAALLMGPGADSSSGHDPRPAVPDYNPLAHLAAIASAPPPQIPPVQRASSGQWLNSQWAPQPRRSNNQAGQASASQLGVRAARQAAMLPQPQPQMHAPRAMQPALPQHPAAAAAAAAAPRRAVLVAKALTNSDTNGRIILPRVAVEANMNFLVGYRAYKLDLPDKNGKVWKFVIKSWANGTEHRRVYVLEQAGDFIKANGLTVGDAVGICTNSNGEMMIEYNTDDVKLATVCPSYGAVALQHLPPPDPGTTLPLLSGDPGKCTRSPYCQKQSGHPGFCSGPRAFFSREKKEPKEPAAPQARAAPPAALTPPPHAHHPAQQQQHAAPLPRATPSPIQEPSPPPASAPAPQSQPRQASPHPVPNSRQGQQPIIPVATRPAPPQLPLASLPLAPPALSAPGMLPVPQPAAAGNLLSKEELERIAARASAGAFGSLESTIPMVDPNEVPIGLLISKKLTEMDISTGVVLLPSREVEASIPRAAQAFMLRLPLRDLAAQTWEAVLKGWASHEEGRPGRVYMLEQLQGWLRAVGARENDVLCILRDANAPMRIELEPDLSVNLNQQPSLLEALPSDGLLSLVGEPPADGPEGIKPLARQATLPIMSRPQQPAASAGLAQAQARGLALSSGSAFAPPGTGYGVPGAGNEGQASAAEADEGPPLTLPGGITVPTGQGKTGQELFDELEEQLQKAREATALGSAALEQLQVTPDLRFMPSQPPMSSPWLPGGASSAFAAPPAYQAPPANGTPEYDDMSYYTAHQVPVGQVGTIMVCNRTLGCTKPAGHQGFCSGHKGFKRKMAEMQAAAALAASQGMQSPFAAKPGMAAPAGPPHMYPPSATPYTSGSAPAPMPTHAAPATEPLSKMPLTIAHPPHRPTAPPLDEPSCETVSGEEEEAPGAGAAAASAESPRRNALDLHIGGGSGGNGGFPAPRSTSPAGDGTNEGARPALAAGSGDGMDLAGIMDEPLPLRPLLVHVNCGNLRGIYNIRQGIIVVGMGATSDTVTPAEFEAAAGCGAQGNWKESLWVELDAGAAAMAGRRKLTLGAYLRQQGITVDAAGRDMSSIELLAAARGGGGRAPPPAGPQEPPAAARPPSRLSNAGFQRQSSGSLPRKRARVAAAAAAPGDSELAALQAEAAYHSTGMPPRPPTAPRTVKSRPPTSQAVQPEHMEDLDAAAAECLLSMFNESEAGRGGRSGLTSRSGSGPLRGVNVPRKKASLRRAASEPKRPGKGLQALPPLDHLLGSPPTTHQPSRLSNNSRGVAFQDNSNSSQYHGRRPAARAVSSALAGSQPLPRHSENVSGV